MINKEGRFAEYAYCDVWRLREGKLHELRAILVTIGVATQVNMPNMNGDERNIVKGFQGDPSLAVRL